MGIEKIVDNEFTKLFEIHSGVLKQKFNSRRINFYPCSDIEIAQNTIMDLVNGFKKQEGKTKIGFADSVTLHQLDIFRIIGELENCELINPMERFDDGKYKVFGELPAGKLDLPRDQYFKLMSKLWDKMRESLNTDIFITGANAITLNGQIVSTDGTGNRVSGMIFGPEKVIIVVGKNKICRDLEEAIKRNRNVAAPLNYFRHNLKHHNRFDNPCMKLGYCTDCNSPRRGCLKTVIIDGEMEGFKNRTHLVLVNEELGF